MLIRLNYLNVWQRTSLQLSHNIIYNSCSQVYYFLFKTCKFFSFFFPLCHTTILIDCHLNCLYFPHNTTGYCSWSFIFFVNLHVVLKWFPNFLEKVSWHIKIEKQSLNSLCDNEWKMRAKTCIHQSEELDELKYTRMDYIKYILV